MQKESGARERKRTVKEKDERAKGQGRRAKALIEEEAG
jgi:hypothetical protein